MLKGDLIALRTVRERDLDHLYDLMSDLESRGDHYPLGFQGESAFRTEFAESGFWGRDEGMLLMIDSADQIVGEIEFFPVAAYLRGYEISYRLFDEAHRGRGYTTEALKLLVGYLFGRKTVNRLQLNIHPDNAASKRVAENCGFALEGVMREVWFHGGRFHDLEVWSILRDEALA